MNSVKSFCVLKTSDINQTSLFELKVGCLSYHKPFRPQGFYIQCAVFPQDFPKFPQNSF